METIASFLMKHAGNAHWYILIGVLLAGCNIPISIDLLVILAAVLAANFIPENTLTLYFFLLVGCALSAWIAYFLGRFLGQKLSQVKLFSPILHPKKLEKIERFYQKYGIWAYIVGRFIPFGVRNCVFMSSGLSRMPFLRFAYREIIACFIWVTLSFSVFFELGQNYEKVWDWVKTFNLVIFIAFSLAVISIIWYKRRKNKHVLSESSSSSQGEDLSFREHSDQKHN